MKPLILEYLETSQTSDVTLEKVIYDEKLNLSVDVNTGQPAISFLNMSTETFTKTFSEVSDSDKDLTAVHMGTLTQTHSQLESSDNDNDIRSLSTLMSTRTITESQEVSDSDK